MVSANEGNNQSNCRKDTMNTRQAISEEEAIRMYLGISPRPSRSCFRAVLVDARKFTGRNMNNGSKLPDSKHGCWLGALGYMALLDQIGTCLKPKRRNEDGNKIEKALKYFTNLDEAEIQAIYALRCAFVHDYSLANTNERQDRQHVFTVCEGDRAPLVQLPAIPWDGVYHTDSRDNRTIINLEAFGDLVESIRKKVCEQVEDEGLEIALRGGVAELLTRFFFSVR